MRHRFDGAIIGVGTTSGTRLVLGLWPRSPYGPVYDAMVETPDGHRVLVAPTAELAEFIAATYTFDEVRIEPTALRILSNDWTFASNSLTATVAVGRRSAIGVLLTAVPRPVARSRTWCRAVDPIARRMRPGVRTVGTAGGGRREWYGAYEERHLVRASAVWDGNPLGALTDIDPPVRFGFGSTPRTPSWVRLTSTVEQ